MAGSVFVVGSLHLDVVIDAPRLPAVDETVTGRDVDFVCGGKGGNQAVAAARHGAAARMAGRVGDDAFGERLLAHLDAAGVDRSRVRRVRGSRSGMSVAVVLDNGDYGAVIVSAANLELAAQTIDWPDDAAVLLLQNEVPEPVNLAMARQARAHGARVILNAAPWRETSTALLEHVDVLVLNRVEAAAMHGAPVDSVADARRAADALASRGIAIIVTLGADGAVYAAPAGGAEHRAAFAADVVSSHGAGDVFAGALAARLAADDAMSAALRYGMAAAAVHVSTPVADRLGVGPERVAALLAASAR